MALHPDFLRLPLTHRTLHDVTDGRPENSVEGTLAALDAGYGIEIDVQLSKDGQAVVFHDSVLDRVTDETGPVRARNLVDLKKIPLRGGKQGIPALTEILTLIGGRVPLLIEIKDQDGALGENVGPLEKAVCAAIKTYSGHVALMSFNPHSVAKCAELCPEIPRGLVTEDFRAESYSMVPESRQDRLCAIEDYNAVGACFISHDVDQLDAEVVADIKKSGSAILCWTVKSAEQEARARKVADNITFEGYLAVLPTVDL